MLLQVWTAVQSLSRGLFFWSNAEEALATNDQGSDIDARLPELWFADIPHCTLQCLYGPALACGCAYSDFDCICRAFSEIADNDDIKACITACPHNEDGRWAPDRILDFCHLVTGDDIQLPHYMDQYAGPHRRNAIPDTDLQEDSVVYSDYSNYGPSATAFSNYEPSATTFITTSEPTTHTTTKPIITSAPTTSVSVSSSSSSPSPSGGLSTGAKAGIGVAVPLVVIGILLGIFWYLRRQRGNKKNVSRGNGGENLPDMGKRMWSKNFFSTASRPLPAEADSNPIHESGGNPVLSSQHLRDSDTMSTPIVHELSAHPSIRAPPPAVLASNRREQSTEPASPKDLSASDTLSQIATSSPVSFEDSKTATARGADTTTLGNIIGNTSPIIATPAPTVLQHQSLQDNQKKNVSLSAESTNSIDTELLNLEAEIARVREQRERLQHLQLLEDREEQLRKEIEARKSSLSKQA